MALLGTIRSAVPCLDFLVAFINVAVGYHSVGSAFFVALLGAVINVTAGYQSVGGDFC